MAERIDVVAAAIVRNGTVLCAQRGCHGELPGLWEFPGGKVESGESSIEALQRELREELSLEVEVGSEIAATAYVYPFAEVTLTTFVCDLHCGEPILHEHRAVAWLAPSKLGALEWAPADLPAVKALQHLLCGGSAAGVAS